MSLNYNYIPKGVPVEGCYLNNLLPHAAVYEHELFYTVLCIYPTRKRVNGFKQMFLKMQELLQEKLLPAYSLVEGGSVRSYFAIYVKK
jgi:hypothetical protein